MNHDLVAVQLAAACLDLLEGTSPAPPPNLDCDDAAAVIVSLSILCARLTHLAGTFSGVPPETILQNYVPSSA